VKEVTFFNVDYVSKSKSLIDGYLEVYEGLCDVKKVHKKSSFFLTSYIVSFKFNNWVRKLFQYTWKSHIAWELRLSVVYIQHSHSSTHWDTFYKRQNCEGSHVAQSRQYLRTWGGRCYMPWMKLMLSIWISGWSFWSNLNWKVH
jgi:hypothetical protein